MGYLGVDPGKTGGWVLLDSAGDVAHVGRTVEYPGVAGLLERFRRYDAGGVTAILEQVGGYVGKPQPGAYMFEFGRNYGRWETILTACGIPWKPITPQRWQAALGLAKEKLETREGYKRRLKKAAEGLFPAWHVTMATADAYLIARYCYLTRRTT